MEKVIMTQNLKLKRRGLNGEHTPLHISKSIEEKLNEFETKTKESFSSVMLSSYKDLGLYGMTIDEPKPTSENSNKILEKSQEVFSTTTIASYKDLGRYGMTTSK